jgi:tripartite-type tricarboxylate transporter receptor subunit TctC
VQTIEQAKHREILMAGTVPSNTSNFIPAALNDLIGTKIKVIMGFRGSPDQALAMLRGEVNSIGGMSWEAIQTNHKEWLTEKKIRILYAQGAQRIKELPNEPGLLDFAVDERSRNILGLLGSGPDIGRSIVAEPGIPADRAAALRKAFMATMEDPEFIAEIAKRNLTIEPLSGEEIQRMVAASVATPKELVDQAKRYVGPIKQD